jgi:glutamate dehydrogenase
MLKADLLKSDVIDEPYVKREMLKVFPQRLIEQYEDELLNHKLSREITATQITNEVVDTLGMTFLYRLYESTGASLALIAKAYLLLRDVIDLQKYWKMIENLDNRVPAQHQLSMMKSMISLMRKASRWIIKQYPEGYKIEDVLERFKTSLNHILMSLPQELNANALLQWQSKYDQLCKQQVPDQLAHLLASIDHMFGVLGLVEMTQANPDQLKPVLAIYYQLEETLELEDIYAALNKLKVENHWQVLARESFHDELDQYRRKLAFGILNHFDGMMDVKAFTQDWLSSNELLLQRWKKVLQDFLASETKDFSIFIVLIKELSGLADHVYG